MYFSATCDQEHGFKKPLKLRPYGAIQICLLLLLLLLNIKPITVRSLNRSQVIHRIENIISERNKVALAKFTCQNTLGTGNCLRF